MTAGTSRVAFRVEDGYQTPGAGDWIQPGLNIEVTDLSIDNQLTRNRNPDDVAPVGSREGNFVGTASLNWDLTDGDWHDLLPLSGGTISGQGGQAPSAEWYFGTTALDDTGSQFDESITAAGGSITEASVSYSQGEHITIEVTVSFGGLSDSSPADGDIIQPTNDEIFTHHGADLEVGGRSQSGMQTATLSLANLARRQEQQSRTPRNMVQAGAEPELSSDAIFSEVDQLELAAGGSATSVGDLIEGEASGVLSLENGVGDTIEYTLSMLQPQDYSWAALVDPDTDLTEPVTYHVADVEPSYTEAA